MKTEIAGTQVQTATQVIQHSILGPSLILLILYLKKKSMLKDNLTGLRFFMLNGMICDDILESEEQRKKIKVEIKPLAAVSPIGPNGSVPTDNMEYIKQSMQGLRLSPTSSVSQDFKT